MQTRIGIRLDLVFFVFSMRFTVPQAPGYMNALGDLLVDKRFYSGFQMRTILRKENFVLYHGDRKSVV